MIKGIGTDLVDVARIEKSLARFGDRFAQKILSATELSDFKKSAQPIAFVAKRFSAKEAVSKALGTGMRQGVGFTTMTIVHAESGQPNVQLHGAAKRIAQMKGIAHWHISISDERQFAVAFVVAES